MPLGEPYDVPVHPGTVACSLRAALAQPGKLHVVISEHALVELLCATLRASNMLDLAAQCHPDALLVRALPGASGRAGCQQAAPLHAAPPAPLSLRR